jgi:hypothetical protein
MLLRRLALAALATLALSTPALAIDWSVLLPEGEVASLPEGARASYAEAARLNDLVALDSVVEELAKAASEAPEHIGVQFLLLNRARDRARTYYGTANYATPGANMRYSSPPNMVAEPYLDLADTAIQRLSGNANLNAEQRRRLEAHSTAVSELRSGLEARDKARAATGLPLIEDIRADRLAYLDSKTVTEDPLDPFPVYENGIKKAADAADGTALGEGFTDPFALLPGEVIAKFLPPPPAPVGNFGGEFGQPQVQLDEFGNPITTPQVDPGLGAPADPGFGAPADPGADPGRGK